MNIEDMLDSLLEQAKKMEPVGHARIYSAIEYKNKIISFGHCQYKTHPFQKRFSDRKDRIFLHAEIDAIKNAINHMGNIEFLSSSVLYIARARIIDGEWQPGIACACEGCKRAIATFGIPRVIYTLNNEGFDEL